jgi:hypothetical protein
VRSALTTVAFSVEPSTTPRGILVPSMVIPNATTQRCSAKWTPSINRATRSSSERSALIISSSARSVICTNRRLTAERDVERAEASTATPTGSRPAR